MIAICAGGCSDHGSCSPQSTPPQCVCFVGWTGDRCDRSTESSIGNTTSTQMPGKQNSKQKQHLILLISLIVVGSIVLVVALVLVIGFLVGPMKFRSIFASKPDDDYVVYMKFEDK